VHQSGKRAPGRGAERCHISDRNGDGHDSPGNLKARAREAILSAQRALLAAQTSADSDQSAADADQTSSDADQAASTSDQLAADHEQLASDRDQAIADRDHAASTEMTAVSERDYLATRDEREMMSVERLESRLERLTTSAEREVTATHRDANGRRRDATGGIRDASTSAVARLSTPAQEALLKELEDVRAQAAADRAVAAADRARAAMDRANAALDRAKLEAELRSAHLDELTGAYRREMGQLALSHEIDRARRSDGRFVLAFVDVDRLKAVNDRDGHAAGDRALQVVVREIRSHLRSFDPIIRYGGDEFVAGLGGTDLEEAQRRFEKIGIAIEGDAKIGISVGLAVLVPDDTPERLTERADAAMLEVKARHHATG
jgi:diguanylate cyclase (GGDEF)-like protein